MDAHGLVVEGRNQPDLLRVSRMPNFPPLGRSYHAGPLAEAQDALHGRLASRATVAEVN
jgi:hypothetical protein